MILFADTRYESVKFNTEDEATKEFESLHTLLKDKEPVGTSKVHTN